VFTDAIKDSLEILENTYFEVFPKKKSVCPNLHQQKQEQVTQQPSTNTVAKPTYYK
jgi:hypothetical protein